MSDRDSAGNPAEETTLTGRLQKPWTISNKYYTAPVHFSITETSHVKAEDAVDVPACIFVFSLKEVGPYAHCPSVFIKFRVMQSFKEDFTSLMSRFEDSDFEVSIAVSVPSTPGAMHSSEDEQDALETFFGEHGFEYVNGNPDSDPSQEHDIQNMEGHYSFTVNEFRYQ